MHWSIFARFARSGRRPAPRARSLVPRPGTHRYPAAVGLIALGAGIELLGGAALAQAPIRIGASLGLTGVYAEFGQALQRGYKLCVDAANGKGGVLGRKLELKIEDDKSDTPTAVAIYERLIAQEKVDLVFSPYSTPMTDAVAAVTDKHGRPMVAAGAASPSIFKKGRRFLFMFLSPAESYLEGFIDIAGKRGLKSIAVIYEDTVFPKGVGRGAAELARKRGMQVASVEAYPRGTRDFKAILSKVKAANADVIVAAGYYDDAVAITRDAKELDLNPKMLAATVGSGFPKFHETLGRAAEYVYGASPWEAALASLRAGGLVPIARQYPGAREFAEAYRKEFASDDMPYQTAQAYGACELTLEGVRRAGSLDGERIRTVIARYDSPTAFGAFKLDRDGVQTGHKILLFQWQDGKKIIVWPEEIAPVGPRFPTPPWTQRKGD